MHNWESIISECMSSHNFWFSVKIYMYPYWYIHVCVKILLLYVNSRMLYFHTDMRSHLKKKIQTENIYIQKNTYMFSVHFTFSALYSLCKNKKNKTKTSTYLPTCSKQCACHYERVYWDAERHEMGYIEDIMAGWRVWTDPSQQARLRSSLGTHPHDVPRA